MPHYIVRLKKGEEVRYLEWSTVCDAPFTYGMTRAEFGIYYRARYPDDSPPDSIDEYEVRMERVDATGISALDTTADSLFAWNRAGPKETHLDFDGIWERYVVNRGES